ncbi:MAG: DUF262 domain-containing protein [Synergistaceae bacterium]|nr:DUF262 domain-containing protein [Synergistaceae bacterium]
MINGSEYPLQNIFSAAFIYEIPSFQRPYAWKEDNAGELFDDLFNFWNDNKANNEQYFLGSIVLEKQPHSPQAIVIDGQQRLTTLTILFSVMASKFPAGSTDRASFSALINEPGGLARQAQPRLSIREKDNHFFKIYIQDINIDALVKLDPNTQDTEAKTNIIKNAKVLLERVNNNLQTPADIKNFGVFLVTRCFLVTVSTPTTQSAFRIFSVLNTRGMDLLVTDILKSDIISVIDEDKRDDYNRTWEDKENEIGRTEFIELFNVIRMIKLKTKARENLLDEFNKKILPKPSSDDAEKFINEFITPYSQAMLFVKVDKPNEALRWLNRLDNSDWVPVAMSYYAKFTDYLRSSNNPEFFKKLERLAAYMLALSFGTNDRIERYAKVLEDIEKASDGKNFGTNIELTAQEKKDFIAALNSDIYLMWSPRRKYLILRLDSFMSAGGAQYNPSVFSIEHVLPQTVNAGSSWEALWPNVSERDRWLNKIGNLAPLERRLNSKAKNFDFARKKSDYFFKNGATSYILTNELMSINSWTPQVVEDRQKRLIKIYCDNWELN